MLPCHPFEHSIWLPSTSQCRPRAWECCVVPWVFPIRSWTSQKWQLHTTRLALTQMTDFAEKCEEPANVMSACLGLRRRLTIKTASNPSKITQSKSDSLWQEKSANSTSKYISIACVDINKIYLCNWSTSRVKRTSRSSLRCCSIIYTESHHVFTSLRGWSSGTWTGVCLPLLSFAVNHPRSFPSWMNARKPSLHWSEEHRRQTILQARRRGLRLIPANQLSNWGLELS